MVTFSMDWMEVAALEGVLEEKVKAGVEDELLKKVLYDIWAKLQDALEEDLAL